MDAQIEVNKRVGELDHGMHEAGAKLSELAAASEEKWGRSGVRAAAAKCKD